jgi:hypothetical protein
MRLVAIFETVLLAAISVIGTLVAQAQSPKAVTPPLSLPQAEYYRQHPQELQQLLGRLSQEAQQLTPAKPLAPGETPQPGSWTSLNNSPGVALQNPLLMTDGSVIAMRACTGNWYKLTPDNTGSYINGTWTQIATMPSGYGPLFGGSGVLPDGRVIFEGGEYNDPSQSGNCGSGAWTNLGAIYNPVTNTWTAVSPPNGWTFIGDAAGIVLDNGTYMQSDCCDTSGISGLSALLNPNTLTWTATGSSKLDRWDEEGMAKLQNGDVLVVDAHTNNTCSNSSEIYNSDTGTFSATGNTVDPQPDCNNPTGSLSYELGPVMTRQDGSALVFPGILCSDKANTNCANQASGFVVIGKADVYDVDAGTWSTLATMPRIGTAPSNYYYGLADAPAAVLPDGNVLFAASPNYQAFVGPTHFFELSLSSPGTITQVGDTADAENAGAYVQNFLLLPTGQVLAVSQLGNIQIYTPLAGSPQSSWTPVITSAPSCVSPGGTYLVNGTQLNGLTEGSYYGDDVQAAVNFPIVRVVNNSTGDVFYAKTFNHSTRSIAPSAVVQTDFTVASATELGASTLYVVGAGIPSAGTAVTVQSSCPADKTATHDFNGDGYSDIAWRDTSGDAAVWLMSGTQMLQSGVIATVPVAWSIVGQRDFNGDGKADLLWRDTSGNITIWFMNGISVAGSASVGNIPTSWSIVGTADFNGDGYGDILWKDNTGNVAIWLMQGSSILQGGVLGNVGTSWTVAGTADFNGDGKADILWMDNAGNLAIWLMNGLSVSQSGGLGNVGTSWNVVGTGDFNGDGKGDILWKDNADNMAMWLMNGFSVSQAGGLLNVGPSYNVAVTGDFNGDGKSDILWCDTSGNVAMWLMNGLTISEAVVLENISTSWTIQGLNAD